MDPVQLGWLLCCRLFPFATVAHGAQSHRACRWVDGVMTEFFAQGDAERERGLTISMNCDRHKTQTAACQVCDHPAVESVPALYQLKTNLPRHPRASHASRVYASHASYASHTSHASHASPLACLARHPRLPRHPPPSLRLDSSASSLARSCTHSTATRPPSSLSSTTSRPTSNSTLMRPRRTQRRRRPLRWW